MNKHTKKPQHGEISMEEVYNLLMYDIEPELMTEFLPDLDRLYKDETPEERQARMARYKYAFAIFYERFDILLDAWKGELQKFRKEMFTQLQQKALSQEGEDISGIEQSIRDA